MNGRYRSPQCLQDVHGEGTCSCPCHVEKAARIQAIRTAHAVMKEAGIGRNTRAFVVRGLIEEGVVLARLPEPEASRERGIA